MMTTREAAREVAQLWIDRAPIDRDMSREAFDALKLAATTRNDDRAAALLAAVETVGVAETQEEQEGVEAMFKDAFDLFGFEFEEGTDPITLIEEDDADLCDICGEPSDTHDMRQSPPECAFAPFVREEKPRAVREPYTAAELFENNAPNVWAVMKRATPGARQFNGEIVARCKDEATARTIAALLNKEAR